MTTTNIDTIHLHGSGSKQIYIFLLKKESRGKTIRIEHKNKKSNFFSSNICSSFSLFLTLLSLFSKHSPCLSLYLFFLPHDIYNSNCFFNATLLATVEEEEWLKMMLSALNNSSAWLTWYVLSLLTTPRARLLLLLCGFHSAHVADWRLKSCSRRRKLEGRGKKEENKWKKVKRNGKKI